MKTIRNLLMLVMSLTFIGVTACNAEPDGELSKVIHVEKSSDLQPLIDGEIPVLVDFHATWCRPCRIQGPILDELAGELQGKIIIVKVDVDKLSDLASKYEVSGLPSLILFDSGQQIWKKVGLQQKEELMAAIKKHLDRKKK